MEGVPMAFRKVAVIQAREVLRKWLRNDSGERSIAEGASVDRKTARRYIEAAEQPGDSPLLRPNMISLRLAILSRPRAGFESSGCISRLRPHNHT